MVIIFAAELKFEYRKILNTAFYNVWLSYAALKAMLFLISQQYMRISMALVREYDVILLIKL